MTYFYQVQSYVFFCQPWSLQSSAADYAQNPTNQLTSVFPSHARIVGAVLRMKCTAVGPQSLS